MRTGEQGATNQDPHFNSHPTHKHTRRVSKMLVLPLSDKIIEDQWTDRQTKPPIRVACPQLKKSRHLKCISGWFYFITSGWNPTFDLIGAFADVVPSIFYEIQMVGRLKLNQMPVARRGGGGGRGRGGGRRQFLADAQGFAELGYRERLTAQ